MSRIIKWMYVGVVGLLAIILLAINFQYQGMESRIKEEVAIHADITVQLLKDRVEYWTEMMEHVFKISEVFFDLHSDQEDRLFYLESQLAGHPYFDALFFEGTEGTWISTDDSIQPSVQSADAEDWYKNAIYQNGLSIEEPQIDENGDRFILISYPVYFRDGTLLGVAGGKMSLATMQGILGSDGVFDDHITYLLTGSGTVIFSSPRAVDPESDLRDMKVWLQAEAEHSDASPGETVQTLGDVEGVFTAQAIGASDWVLYNFTPLDSISHSLKSLRYFTYTLAGLATLVFALLFFIQGRYFARPLLELERQVAQIDIETNPGYQVKIYPEPAFGKLTTNLNHVLDKSYEQVRLVYQDKNELSALNEELTALNEELEASFSQLVATEQEVTRQKMNFEALFRYFNDAVVMFDQNHCVVDVNERFENMFGYTLKEIFGKNLDDVVTSADIRTEAEEMTKALFKGALVRLESVRYSKSGEPLNVSVQGVPMLYDGITIGGYAIYSDISGRKMREEYLAYVSTHDDLTDIYNRRYFEMAIVDMDLEKNLPLAIVMIDVNGLKMINDAFGAKRGDDLLKRAVIQISKHCREQDVMARIGGDEFAIIMPTIDSETLEKTVKAMRKSCNELMVDEVPVSVAIGWADKTEMETPVADVLKSAEDYMHKYKLMEGPSVRGKAIFTMIKTLHEKNKREEQHSIRVGELSYRLGKALNLPSRELGDLKMMGLLHDLGKIAIDQNILNKESKLTNEEYAEIKKHPEIGYRILSGVNEMSEIAVYVLAHHESWDGTGYPRGLKGTEIPYLARIITVVDAFDAMTSDRAYRKKMSYEDAFAELRRCSGRQFDPEIVETFIGAMSQDA
ncbi:MAG: hypothetical protein PWQ12_244 [Clostridiales bacterium]|nr:hypothetical protein [Clostridiales bacterium]